MAISFSDSKTWGLEDNRSLVSSLFVRDTEEIFDFENHQAELRETIEELVRRGESVLPTLLCLIERYEAEKRESCYIEYVVEILGRIGGERAINLILRTLLASSRCESGMNDRSGRACIQWLRNLGGSSVPAIIAFAKENYGEPYTIISIAETLEKVKDRRLIPLLLRFLSYSNSLVIQSTLISLREQDEKSVTHYIVPLFGYEDECPQEESAVRELAMGTVTSLLRNDTRVLHKILSEHGPKEGNERRRLQNH